MSCTNETKESRPKSDATKSETPEKASNLSDNKSAKTQDIESTETKTNAQKVIHVDTSKSTVENKPKEVDVSLVLSTKPDLGKYDISSLLKYDGISSRSETPIQDEISISGYSADSEANIEKLLSSQKIPFQIRKSKRNWTTTVLTLSVSKKDYQETINLIAGGIRAKAIKEIPED